MAQKLHGNEGPTQNTWQRRPNTKHTAMKAQDKHMATGAKKYYGNEGENNDMTKKAINHKATKAKKFECKEGPNIIWLSASIVLIVRIVSAH